MTLKARSGRRASARPCQGNTTSPISDTGTPSSTRTFSTLWRIPVTRSSSNRIGPAARYLLTVGSSDQAKMSRPSSDSALLAACAGSGVPNSITLRAAHGANTTTATVAVAPTTASRRGIDVRRPTSATIIQVRASQAASFRVHAASPRTTPSPRTRAARNLRSPPVPTSRAIKRHAPSVRTAKGIVESGRAECSTSGR